MASYTDIIPQFNPYVQELPVQAMVEVGMEKQRRYDEGIQKIQQTIQNVGGIEVGNDASKAYLQSKMNELGSKLKTVAGGDFSNYQLVNSVAGMTTQIVKDPFIRAGAQSAANIRKQQEYMEEERKKGNLTPDNEYNYSLPYSEYLKSGIKDESGKPIVFNKEYVAHFDVDKFVRESFDAVKPGDWTIEQLFETDSNGKMLLQQIKDPKTGKVIEEKPILSKIAANLKLEGRLPEEVTGTLNQIFSDPRVKQQLQITGEYNYRSYTPELLIEKVTNVTTKQLSSLQEKLADLTMKKVAAKNPDDANTYQVAIDKIQSDISGVKSDYSETIDAIKVNPSAVKGAMYMQETKNNWTGMYGSIKESRTFGDNPLFKINFELQKEANDLAIKRESVKIQWANLTETKRANRKKEEDKLTELKLKYPFAFPEIGPMNLADVDANSYFDNLYDKSANIYSGATDNLLFKTFLDNPTNRSAITKYVNSGMTEEQAKAKIIDKVATDKGESSQDLRARWLIKANNYLNQNPGKLDPQLQADLVSAQNAQNVFNTLNEAKRKIDAKSPDDYKKLTESLKPITVDSRTAFGKLYGTILPERVQKWLGMSSGKITLTPQQQYDLAIATSGDKIGQSPTIRAEAKRAQDRLAKQGIDQNTAEIIATNLTGSTTTGSTAFDQFIKSSTPLSPITNIISGKQMASDWIGKDLSGAIDPNVRNFANLKQAIADPNAVLNMEKRAAAIRDIYQFNPVAKAGVLTGKEETDKVYRDNVLDLLVLMQRME